MRKALVTGCAGFIGSHMVDFLLKEGFVVFGIDNLSTGKLEFINKHKKNKKFLFIKKDLIKDKIDSYFKKAEIIFHFAANADVRYGIENRFRDIEQNIIGTYNVLEATIKHKAKIIVFASTGSVYGESKNFPTNEKEQFPIQTSLYANSKLAGEGLISS
jgi:UDP-glucose 4-epimerase